MIYNSGNQYDTSAYYRDITPSIAVPAGNISTGSWTSTEGTFASAINEATPNDTSKIYSSQLTTAGTSDSITLSLSTISDPQQHTDHVIRFRFRQAQAGANAADFEVTLLQSTTEIAKTTIKNVTSNTWTTVSLEIGTTEAAAITDYTDLRIRFKALV